MAEFKFVGGSPCLDFVNTVGAWTSRGLLRDKLNYYEDLLTWGEQSGVLNPLDARRLKRYGAEHPRNAATALTRARQLRHALHRIFASVVQDSTARKPDLETLHKELTIAHAHRAIAPSQGGFVWRWHDAKDQLDRILWPVAECAATLLTSDDLSRVRQCGGEECGWLFLDTSRNGSRQWCDMRDCGNLAKVKRFRQRQRRTHR